MKAIKVNKLMEFINQMRKDGAADGVTLIQIVHFCQGHRGIELCDNAISLLDGTVEVENGLQTSFQCPECGYSDSEPYKHTDKLL